MPPPLEPPDRHRWMSSRGAGLRDVEDTPTPNPQPGRAPPETASDANITRLQSTVLTKTPNTPRRQQVIDMMGEDVIGDLPHLLSELKLQLTALSPPKPARQAVSSLATLTGNSQEGPVSFKCDRVGFQRALTLVDFCHRVATSQAAGAPELAPQALMAGVHASIQEMEARLEDALTEQATTLASAIERLNSVQTQPASFAQAAKAADQPRAKGPKQPKPPPPPLPPSLPEIVLTQTTRGGRAEMDIAADALAARINTAIRVAIPRDPPRIKAFKRVHRTGDLILIFDQPEQAAAVVAAESSWVRRLNPELKIKTKTYTIMVHGIPTSFDPTDKSMVRDLQQENGSKLDSLESIRWANPNSIAIGKPFSSIFISLTDADAANAALFQNVSYQRELRTTERSKKHQGATQCYACQGYGHTQRACTKPPRCAICTGDHPTDECDTVDTGKTYCVNCTEAYVDAQQKVSPAFTKKDITPEVLKTLAHSPQAAKCPIRRAKAAPTRGRDFFQVTQKNATSHAVR